ncbi:MAG: positive regulator of sigma(E) RseC/MucC [Bacteroidetes bacterium]|nr:MAG: positive regulator of sigma(E) RseC/MucC [Bacteroidota bacterium]
MSETVDCIAKSGVVDHLDDRNIYIRILSVSACSACHAKGACTSVESTEKLITVDREHAPEVSPGQTVNVRMDAGNGNLAVVFGYLLPFLILIVTLVILSVFLPEGWAGLFAIIILIPYYSGLYLFRDSLKKRFRFTIE